MCSTKAEVLALPGAWLAPWAPVIAAGAYILIVAFAGKAAKRFKRKDVKWLIRIVAVPVGFVAAMTVASYPLCLVEWYSQRIEVAQFFPDSAEFLPKSVVRDFEERFDTPTLQYSESGGRYLLVPREKFQESMISFLRTRTAEAKRGKNEEGKVVGDAVPDTGNR